MRSKMKSSALCVFANEETNVETGFRALKDGLSSPTAVSTSRRWFPRLQTKTGQKVHIVSRANLAWGAIILRRKVDSLCAHCGFFLHVDVAVIMQKVDTERIVHINHSIDISLSGSISLSHSLCLSLSRSLSLSLSIVYISLTSKFITLPF